MNPILTHLIAVAVAFASGWAVNGWRLDAHHTAQELAAVNKAREEMQKRFDEVRAQETLVRHNLTVVARDLHNNLLAKDKELEKARVNIKSGFQRLLDANARVCPTDLPGSTSTGRRNDGEGRTELPATTPSLSERMDAFFSGEAVRANKIVEKLSACQATVREYERVCNGGAK